jgi:MoaA/NifB/PqqE/SkfB family radical SAM enzyme
MHANLELTNLCNQHCSYCFNGSGPDVDRSREQNDWPSVLGALAALHFKSVHFTGGEPFVLKNILDLMRLALDRRLKISVLSNGHNVARHTRDRAGAAVLQRLEVAQVSLDSMSPAQHDERRGKRGAWRTAVEAVRALTQRSIPTEISCVVDAGNERQLLSILSFAHDQNAKVIVRPKIALGRANNDRYSIPDWLTRELEAFQHLITSDRFSYLPGAGPKPVTILPNGLMRDGSLDLGARGRVRTTTELIAAASA